MDDTQKLINWILKTTVGTLALICIATVGVLLIGLFDNNIDNDRVFEVIGPAFSTVVGAFVGLLGGLSLNSKRGSKDSD